MIHQDRKYYDTIQYVESGSNQADILYKELGNSDTIEMAAISSFSSFHCQPKELDMRGLNM